MWERSIGMLGYACAWEHKGLRIEPRVGMDAKVTGCLFALQRFVFVPRFPSVRMPCSQGSDGAEGTETWKGLEDTWTELGLFLKVSSNSQIPSPRSIAIATVMQTFQRCISHSIRGVLLRGPGFRQMWKSCHDGVMLCRGAQ
jgi:hypothetical protein